MKGSKAALTVKKGRKIVGKNEEDIRAFEVNAGGKHVGYLWSIPSKSWRARGVGQYHGLITTVEASKNQSTEELQHRALEGLDKKLKNKGAI